MTKFKVSEYDQFTLMGVKTRIEDGKVLTTAPVSSSEADFYAVECVNTFTGEEYVLSYTTKDPNEVLDFLNMNDHIRECGIEKLY